MKKNLLASAAVLAGLTYAAGASAQSVTSTTLQGSANGLYGAVNPTMVPDPGSVVVRFGGHYNFYAGAVADSGRVATGAKQQAQEFGDYLHISPSVDGVAANGLRYGVYSDFWMEHPGTSTTATATTGSTGVQNGAGGGSIGSITNNERTNSTLYLRHAWAYVGLPTIGTLRVGTDGPTTLFQTGTFENFNDGGWNGDIPDFVSGNAGPTWPFAAVGNLYGPSKATYLSPQLYGFEIGLSYEPTTSFNNIYDQCNVAGTGCARNDSSNVASDLARRRNTLNTEMRYRGTFGPIGVAAEVGWMGSGTVGANQGGLAGAALTSYQSAARYRGFNIGIGGLAITYGGLTVGGHIQGGDYNGQWGLAPAGGPHSLAYLLGASYTVGPVIVGVQAFQYNSPGNSFAYTGVPTAAQVHVGQERERGIAAGGTYTLTPGVSLFLDYLWGDRKENGFDLLTGTGTTFNGATGVDSHLNNQTRASLIGTGLQIRW
jgi:hypothetical protein